MATRRDELSAYTFARKRTLAAFLHPDSRVSDDEAPRPVRAMVPSVVMSVALVAGCIAWGVIAPSAPKGWDEPGKHIIVDTKSTTRYVVLDGNGKKPGGEQLHPVMNFASGKLVLDKGKGEVIEVAGENIDESSLPRGATIGIPYAPDRLPDREDAESPKEWAVCEKPGTAGGAAQQQALFVLGGKDKQALRGKNRLGDGEALFVQDSKTGKQYLVDGNGTKLQVGRDDFTREERRVLIDVVLHGDRKPQPVSTQWLNTLNSGDDLQFPHGAAAGNATFEGVSELPAEARRIGTVLRDTSTNHDYFVVGKDRLQQVSPLVAKLSLALMGAKNAQDKELSISTVAAANAGAVREEERGGKGWPDDVLKQVNTEGEGIGSTPRTVSCGIYTGKASGGKPELAAWAGSDYPRKTIDGSANAYVTSGSGLLFREFSGRGGGGSQYLLTDSGLRYAVAGGSGQQQAGGKEKESAAARLGYEKAKPVLVPQTWTSLLPKGPSLDTESASQEQGM